MFDLSRRENIKGTIRRNLVINVYVFQHEEKQATFVSITFQAEHGTRNCTLRTRTVCHFALSPGTSIRFTNIDVTTSFPKALINTVAFAVMPMKIGSLIRPSLIPLACIGPPIFELNAM